MGDMGTRSLAKLSARFVATVTTAGLYSDGGGLYLQVLPSGGKSWIFRYMVKGKNRDMGLGGLTSVPLAEAREDAARYRLMRARGIDPIERRKAERAALDAVPLFGEAAEAYIDRMSPQWTNPKHVQQWRNTLRTYCKPIWKKRVDAIETADALACLEPIWLTKPETASRVRGRAEAVLDAEAVKRRDHHYANPFRWKGHLELLLPARPAGSKGRMKSLPFEDAPAFMVDLRSASSVSRDLVEWATLNTNRPGEARFARREEIHGTNWIIPAERMKVKTNGDHVIPLSSDALAMLERLPEKGLLFPNPLDSKKPLSENAHTELLKDMGYKEVATGHGFRSTFRDWAGETTEYPDSLVEFALAHKIGDEVAAAYRRRKGVERRRALMQDWADYLAGRPKAGIPASPE